MGYRKYPPEVYEAHYQEYNPGGTEQPPYSYDTIVFMNARMKEPLGHLMYPEYREEQLEDPIAFDEKTAEEVASRPDPTSELGKLVYEQTEAYHNAAREEREGWAERLSSKITDGIWNLFFKDWDEKMEEGLQRWVDMDMLDENGKNLLINYISKSEKSGPLVYLAVYLLLGKTWLTTTMDSIGGDYAKRIRAEWSPANPANSEVLRAAFIDPDHTTAVRKVMRQNGLSEEDIDLIFLANYALYDPATVRALSLRGELTDAQVFERLREMGYTDTRITEMRKVWDVIPPISDIITMYAKEAFEPDIIRQIGLADEFPTEGVQWAKKHGLSEDWLKKYWYAHWTQPPIQMGFEMLHRKVIDEQELDLMMRLQEIPPFWRDKLTKINYAPYTRVDVRRMHLMGVLTDDELFTAYQDLGYDEKKAGKMVEWTIKYNQGTEKELTRSQIESAYKKRAIIKEDAVRMLMDIGYPEDESYFITDLIDYDEDQKHEDDLLKNIETAYLLRIVNRVDTVNNLNRLGLPGRRIDYLMERWDLALVGTRKLPSKTDFDKFYRNNLISGDDYKDEMRNLGYSEKHITLYEKLIASGKESK